MAKSQTECVYQSFPEAARYAFAQLPPSDALCPDEDSSALQLPKLEVKSQLTVAVENAEAESSSEQQAQAAVDMIEVSFFERPNENNFFKQFEHEECDEGTLF
jgi:hypothetical protein